MADLSRPEGYSPWFDVSRVRPARTGYFEYYDSLLDEIVMMRWNRKKDRWEKNSCILKGDKWRGLSLTTYIKKLEA